MDYRENTLVYGYVTQPLISTVYMPGFSSVLCLSLISASRFVSAFTVSSSPGGAGSVSDSDSDVSLSLASPTS